MAKKKYSTINLFIRSSIFFSIAFPSLCLYGFLCVFTYPFPLARRHQFIRVFLRYYLWLLKVICHIDSRVEGLENISHIRNGVVLSKHQSTWETFFLPLIFYAPAVILKRQLLWLPFFGWGLAATGPIAINRSDKKSAMQQVYEKGKAYLDAGRWVIVFPEGTRVAAGTVGQYRLGGPRLAATTGYPVIPVAHNAGRCWPRRKFIKIPGTVTLVIGPPIATQGRAPEAILADTKAWIESTMLRIDSAHKIIG